MKSLKLISCLFLLTGFILCTDSADAQRADQAYLIKTFDLIQPELVDIRTSGGFIQVKGSDREDVRVEMYVRRNNRYLDDTDTKLEDFEIDIEQDGRTVRAHATRESGSGGWSFWRRGSNISVSFIVYTPSESGVAARTSGGSVTAETLEGDIDLRTSGGSLTLKDLKGRIQARTSGGSITLTDIEGELNARTSGGGIRAERNSGQIELRTSGGSIRLEDMSGELSARTSGGSIRAKMLHVDEIADFRTSGGGIRIEVPEGSGYELDLRGSRVQTGLKDFTGEVERRTVRGTIGGGGPLIRARTSGGTVRISYK